MCLHRNRESLKNTLDAQARLICQCLRICGGIPRPTSIEEQVDFVTSHLERAAREEVTYRYPEEKNTPQKVLKIPKEAFGERATVSQLIAEFYQTKQEPNQSMEWDCFCFSDDNPHC